MAHGPAIDPPDGWGEMSKQGPGLFKRLGESRDTLVMMDWIAHLVGSQVPTGIQLSSRLVGREAELCERAGRALSSLNRKKWAGRQNRPPRISLPAPLGGFGFSADRLRVPANGS